MYVNPTSYAQDFGEVFNAAVLSLQELGGTLRIEPGNYEAHTQPLIPETFNKRLLVDANGVNLKTVGPISGLQVNTSVQRANQVSIWGLAIDQGLNSQAISGIMLNGAWHTIIKECVLTGGGSNNPEWGAIVLKKNEKGINTLWTDIDKCRIGRQSEGGALPYGIRLLDRSNATNITNTKIGSVEVGISIQANDVIVANGVNIDKCTCENGGVLAYTGKFLEIKTTPGYSKLKGVKISNGRYEKMGICIDVMEGLDVQPNGLVLRENQYDDSTISVNNPFNAPIVRLGE